MGLAELPNRQQGNPRFSPANRNGERDISIVQIRVASTQLKIGDQVGVFVKATNRGKVVENDVTIELKINNISIGRKHIAVIAPGQIVEEEFSCVVGKRKSELIEWEATIKPSEIVGTPREKSKKVRYNYVYSTEGDIGILYYVEPPVHQWIAFQAYNKLPSGDLKGEMASYLPTISGSSYYSSSFNAPEEWSADSDSFSLSTTALIEGSWEEDAEARWRAHYWNPDGGYDDGLYVGFESALQKAQEDLWQNAIDSYNSGQKAQAYYTLGRISHLLMDMSVPAHTLLDEHGGPIIGDDQYEEFTKDHYKDIASSSANTGIPAIDDLATYPGPTPTSYTGDLTTLFYNLAEKSDDFDSDDESGESYRFGRGKYTCQGTELDPSKSVLSADLYELTLLHPIEGEYRWTLWAYDDGADEYDPAIIPDYAIFKKGLTHYIYYYESFYEDYDNDPMHYVRIVYTDTTYNNDRNWSELPYDVDNWILEDKHQPELQARAIGYTAGLYQLFWDSVGHSDTDPPTPDPMTWAAEPNQTSTSSITMAATTGTDPTTPISYYFDYYDSPTGGSGGTDSDWQSGTSYSDAGLGANHQYGYRVKARDGNGSETAYSSISYNYTDIETPSGATFGTITSTSIQVKSSNTPSGLTRGSSGLYIDSSYGTNSGWKQHNDFWTCSGLTPNYDCCFHIKARNGDGDETDYYASEWKYTLANQPGISSFYNVTSNSIEANWIPNGNYYYTDYFCENITTGQNSGWMNHTYSWNNTGLSGGTDYSFRAKARNSEGVETAWTILGTQTTFYEPVVNAIEPNSGPIGSYMRITGQHFYDSGSVIFNGGATGQVLSWSDTQILCKVPSAAISGNMVVRGYSDSNPEEFTVIDPGIIYVDANHTPDIENGTTVYPFSTVQRGIDAATTGDEVVVLQGTYTGEGNRDVELAWGKTITVRSSDPADQNVVAATIIDCQGSASEPHRGFNLHNSSTLNGLTIENGYADYGGGISCRSYNDKSIIINCIIRNNTADYGGGMYNSDSSPTVTNCIFNGNVANNQGGGMRSVSSHPIMTNCVFNGNVANSNGGGIYGGSSTITITDCIISSNTSYGRGGGIYGERSSLSITGCNISGNTSVLAGGGISGSCDINDCTIYNNETNGNGGGVATGGPATINNCVISNNTSKGSGGGISSSSIQNIVTITNCSFIGNNAIGAGGGLAYLETAGTVSHCTFTENSADHGGGMSNSAFSSPTVTNCVFTANVADTYGGGMYNIQGSSPTVMNCIFAGNISLQSGGAICNIMWSSPIITNCALSSNSADISGGGMFSISGSNSIVEDCILWGNASPSGAQICDMGGSSVSVTYSNVQGGEAGIYQDPNCTLSWGPGTLDSNPRFIMSGYWDPNGTPEDINDDFWVDGDYHLLSDSPCIDTGDPNYPEDANEFDIDGDARVIGGRIDMGADEYAFGELSDFSGNGIVNFEDFAILANYWMADVCTEPDWCEGCDYDQSGAVNTNDLVRLVGNWLWQAVWYSE